MTGKETERLQEKKIQGDGKEIKHVMVFLQMETRLSLVRPDQGLCHLESVAFLKCVRSFGLAVIWSLLGFQAI